MRARAPGKLVLTGAYAVLEGAEALVVAVDRYALADSARRNLQPSPELRAAFGEGPAPVVDSSQLYEQGHKLGLGSSAAVVVAALASRCSAEELSSEAGRRALFQRARRAHAEAQGGGSGIDIAAACYGGLLSYRLGCEAPERLSWPEGLHMDVFYSGVSAKTSSLIAAVRALRARDEASYQRAMAQLIERSQQAAQAARESAAAFVVAAQRFAVALQQLGEACAAPIVTQAFAAMGAWAAARGEAFFGAGAGGGDVAVRLACAPISPEFLQRATELGLQPVALQIDHGGAQRL